MPISKKKKKKNNNDNKINKGRNIVREARYYWRSINIPEDVQGTFLGIK